MEQQNQIVTVTINPAIDQTILIPNFTAGAVNRVLSSQMDAGGKGINVAAFLADFGLPVTATGFLGAGNDSIFRQLFARKGIRDRCIRISGQTRIGVKICDTILSQTTDINFPGEPPGPAEIDRLFETLTELAAGCDWFVLSGSIPRGVSSDIYEEMVRILPGKKVLLDTSGEGLRLALRAGPWLVKPNLDELSEFAGRPVRSPGEIIEQALAIMNTYAVHSVVVSMGAEGAVFVEEEAAVWAMPPVVTVKSTVGAGDAMVAGIIAGEMRGLHLTETARLATAFSAAAISHIGAGLPSKKAVLSYQEQVEVRSLRTGV